MALKDKANKVGINEIAAALNISKSTVSRALNNHPKISDATKKKVLKQSKQLGYQPNIPDLMSNKESSSIALIIPHSKNAFFSDIIKSVREYFNTEGYSIFVCESNYDTDIEHRCIEQIKSLNFQALVYVSHKKSKNLEILNHLVKQGFPLSLIHENQIESPVSTVILDIHQSFSDSINHLKLNGAKRISFIISEKNNAITKQANSLFKTMLENENLEYLPELIIDSAKYDDDINAIVDELFENKLKPNALIFDSYSQAFKAHQAINDFYPEYKNKILIMSINSNDLMLYARPNITYLNLQGNKMGEEAAKLVVKQIKEVVKPSTKVLFSRLIIKSSSILA